MRRAGVVLFFLFFSQFSSALEVYTSARSVHPTEWTFHYSENKKWVLETVALDNEGWPVLKKRQISDYEYQGLQNITKSVDAGVLRKSSDLPLSEAVLKGKAGQALWTVTNEWSLEWEAKYAEWVKTLDAHWWKNNGIRTDCADVAYSAKWIFARMNGLPMANRLAAGAWFTHESVKPEWMKLPTAADWRDDKRFRAALDYMLDFVFTHSLWRDSYPIAINPRSLTPGAHHLHINDTSGHTQFVWQVGTQSDQVPVITLNSGIPREARDLFETIYTESAADPKKVAFLKIRWPKFENGKPGLVEREDMPNFSLEQFDPTFIQPPRNLFYEEVFYRVNPTADFDLMASRGLQQLTDLYKQRIQVVEDGYRACSAKPCVEGTPEWEEWSTPSRDKRLSEMYTAIERFTGFVKRPEELEKMKQEPILTQEGYTFTLQQLITAWSINMHSSDPNDEPVTRWGVAPRGISNKVSSVYNKYLPERDTLINKPHNCKTVQCEVGSPEYNKASSADLDSKFWVAASQAQNYCNMFSPQMCADMKSRLKNQSITAGGITANLWDWIEQTQYFNSDPRHSIERRYFSYSHDFAHVGLGYEQLADYSVFEKKRGFIGRTKQFLLLDGAHVSEWNPPDGEQALGLDRSSGWIWTSKENLLLARKDEKAAPLTYGFANEIVFLGADSNGVVIADGPVIRQLKIENGLIRELASYTASPGYNYGSSLSGFAIGVMADGSTLFLDVAAGTATHLNISSNLIYAAERRGGDVILQRGTPDQLTTVCSILSPGRAPHDLNKDGRCWVVSPTQQEAVIERDGKVFLVKYRDWQQVSERELGKGGWYSERLIRLQDAPPGARFYCVNSNGINAIPTDGIYVEACNDRFYIDISPNRVWRLRSIADGRILKSTSNFLSFGSDDLNESLLLMGHYNDMTDINSGRWVMMDLDHPERFALLTDKSLYRSSKTGNSRASGVMIQRGSGALWLAY